MGKISGGNIQDTRQQETCTVVQYGHSNQGILTMCTSVMILPSDFAYLMLIEVSCVSQRRRNRECDVHVNRHVACIVLPVLGEYNSLKQLVCLYTCR